MTERIVEPLLGEVLLGAKKADEALRKDNESHARAMPMQRLLGGGMEYADAMALHSIGDRATRWVDAAIALAERNLTQARIALGEGNTETARASFHYASACFRFGHSAITSDTEEKRGVYARMVSSFSEAARLECLDIRKMDFAYREGQLCGWLVRPSRLGPMPLVVCLGGFDGWREEYFLGAQYLAERGVATLLLDGIGQGESRLFHRLYLGHDFTEAVSVALDQIASQIPFTAIGIWGNSMGGFLAAACAIQDSRIIACCVNGGTVRPAEILDRYPRFIEKVKAILGVSDSVEAETRMREFDIGPSIQGLSCPLLQLHGEPDQVFLLENARRIYDGAMSSDKSLIVWRDGDHCIYNHTHEKYTELADWFESRLRR
ncbi:alpha/beta hydrolase family protein [Eoetvoesiella caeni]|uniref:Alpha/beta hydrolase family protein DUF1100 n=1 Tax=Eoetvoesiella caeni TaxID=645616 RepID=A0A366HB45_9BURK|nr:alpha/beta fold hydrolase [Eoetvoesiella caeni]MCI2809162.1 alpha/beta fold hydrolase [Eoetvoesiella caeni]NYT54304.1 alpha/beta fold hydrolase [Eoetvoesiella caeni]RBP39511.1 alpha/beta hydrolase family protein DUF1100 [Eoetvoesiella caeni]